MNNCSVKSIQLIEFVCPHCHRHLIWTLINSEVYCSKCKKWIKFSNIANLNPARINIINDCEQMVL